MGGAGLREFAQRTREGVACLGYSKVADCWARPRWFGYDVGQPKGLVDVGSWWEREQIGKGNEGEEREKEGKKRKRKKRETERFEFVRV